MANTSTYNYNPASLLKFAIPEEEKPFDWPTTIDDFFYGINGWHNTFVIGAILYVPCVFILQKLMTFCNPVPSNVIKPFLLLWNIWMGIFSLIGAYYVVPTIFQQLNKHSWSLPSQVCDEGCYSTPGAVWVFIFNITKMMEWVDTLFILVQKKPLIFLHWFHHIVTMLYCWHATIYSSVSDCSGMYFAGMNLFVHAVMYGYYGLRTLYSLQNKKFKLFSPTYITILQIVQMVIGVSITILSGFKCEKTISINWHGLTFAGLMYASYFYMFAQLFIKKSNKQKNPTKKSKKIE